MQPSPTSLPENFSPSLPIPILLAFVLVYLIRVYLTATYDHWLIRGVPHRRPIPLFGNCADLLLFRKSQPDAVRDMYNWFPNEKYYGLFRIKTPMLVVRDPELVGRICVKDFDVFRDRGIPSNATKEPLAGHLFNLEGEHWKLLRSKLTPTFSTNKLKNMFHLLTKCSESLKNSIDKKIPINVEVRESIANFTIDVIGSCVFGIRINALGDDDDDDGISMAFRRAARRLSRPSYGTTLWRMLRTALPGIYRALGVRTIDPEVTDFFLNIVSQMVNEREKTTSPKRHDFMDLLIELKHNDIIGLDNENETSERQRIDDNENNEGKSVLEEKKKEIVLDDKAIAAQAFVFFVAGYESSTNTMAFCLYELAVNPEIQERVRRDVFDNLDRSHGKLTYDAVQDMKYLNAVMLETLRKYPSVSSVSRVCNRDYKLPGTDVELSKGTRVVVPIYGIHHDPSYYHEPEAFRPERFFNDDERPKLGGVRSCVFLPFGEGPRNCIGMRFALLLTKIGVITFLMNYRVEVCEKTILPIKFSKRSLVTASENGIWLRITRLE